MPFLAELAAGAGRLAAHLPVPSSSSGDEVHRVTDRVLSRPEFREPALSPVARARRWMLEQFGHLIERLLDGARGSVVGWLVVAALVVGLVLVLVRFAKTVRPDPEVAAGTGRERGRGAADWRAEADARAARGEWRAALRCRYRALIAELAARGVVDEVPGRTTGEYATEVQVGAPAAAGVFDGATDLFVRAWYGNEPTGADEDARFRDLAATVLDRLTAPLVPSP